MRRLRAAEVTGEAAKHLRHLIGVAVAGGMHDGAEVLRRLVDRSVGGRSSLPHDEAHEQRQRVLNRDGWRCRNGVCRSDKNLTVDHIVPRSQQGPDDDDNLWTLCARCHELKEQGILVAAQAQEGPSVGRWLVVDTRKAVRCAACHRDVVAGQLAYAPTTGGGARPFEAAGPPPPPFSTLAEARTAFGLPGLPV